VTNKASLAQFALILSIALAVVFTLLAALLVRPIADDYCYTLAVDSLGWFGFTLEQSTGWSGAFVTNLSASLFGTMYGISYQLAYAVLFLFTFFLLCVMFARVLVTAFNFRSTGNLIRVVPIAIVLSFTFILAGFGVPASLASTQFAYGYSSFTWAASVLSQFIPTLVFLLLGTLLADSVTTTAGRIRPAVLFTGSVILPLMSLQAGTAWLIALVYFTLRRSRYGYLPKFQLPSLATVTFMMLAVNALSPGSRSRKDLIGGTDLVSILSGLATSLKQSIGTLLSGLTLISLIAGIAVALLIAKSPRANSSVVRVFVVLTVSALLATLATDSLGAFEPWHQIGLRLTVFVFGVLIGVSAQAAYSNRNPTQAVGRYPHWRRLRLLVIFAWALALLIQGAWVVSIFVERARVWDNGKAFRIEWIADREVDWIQSCSERATNNS